jgi:hypothetical protein
MMGKQEYGALIVVAVLISGLLLAVGSATAAGYYNNSTGVVQDDTPQNATLKNIVEIVVDLSPSIIGAGEQDPSNTGFQGFLLVGLAYGGATVAAIIGAGVGPIGGSILGSVIAYGLVDLGFAPPWFKPLLLFFVGILGFMAFRRVVDS